MKGVLKMIIFSVIFLIFLNIYFGNVKKIEEETPPNDHIITIDNLESMQRKKNF